MLLPDEEVRDIAAERTFQAADDDERERFVIEQDGVEAELRYRLRGSRLLLLHTEVPSQLEGQGIGGSLVRAAVARATREGLTLVPHCRFANAWLRRHSAVAETVEIAWPPDKEVS